MLYRSYVYGDAGYKFRIVSISRIGIAECIPILNGRETCEPVYRHVSNLHI